MVQLLASCRERSHLYMAHPHDMSFQGTLIAHSNGRTVIVLPTPCMATDQHAGLPRCPQGWNGTWQPTDNARTWHHQRTGLRHGAIPITACSVGGTCTKEKKGPATMKDVLSLRFSSLRPL